MQCPLCQFEELLPLSHRQIEDGIFHCQNCDLIFKRPELFWDWKKQETRYSQHQNEMDNPGYLQFFEQLLKPLRPLISPGLRALDWGSGPGEKPVLAELLKQEGLQVETYDPIYQSQIPMGSFQLITSTEVIEHFQEPKKSFEQILRLLEPQGIFAGLTQFHREGQDFANWWYVKDPTHVVFYSEKTFLWIAEKWNLKILHLRHPVFIFRKK